MSVPAAVANTRLPPQALKNTLDFRIETLTVVLLAPLDIFLGLPGGRNIEEVSNEESTWGSRWSFTLSPRRPLRNPKTDEEERYDPCYEEE